MPKFYLTTPIYYVNARLHMGHAYTTIAADTIARYKRMRGYDVVLLTGTDEHGQKIERAAKAAGITPQQLADRIADATRTLWKELDLQIDRFIRTTELRHEHSVHNLLLKARDAGYIYKGSYEGQYCVFDELYVDDPTPNAPCPECGRPTERVREENYYFKLSEFQDRLLALYESQPDFIRPETRRNEVIAFVRGGLRDLSISRTTLKWGIEWPYDEKHVIYVWYDALTSYMTGVGYGDDELQWEKYWPADLHLIGKEIIRFHAVYWPAFLMAAGEPLPKQVFAHGWLLFDQEKMSKSKGNILLPEPVSRTLGVDALRYALLRDIVFGQDGNFSHDAVVGRYNSDLANGLGNLASRVVAMINQYCAGEVPDVSKTGPYGLTSDGLPQSVTKLESDLMASAERAIREAKEFYEGFEFSRALESIWRLVADVDGYLTFKRPWTLAKDPTEKWGLFSTLYYSAEALRVVTALAHPVLPHATRQIWEQLGQSSNIATFSLDSLEWGQLHPGTRIGEAGAIFPRVKKDDAIERMEAMEQELRNDAAKPADTPAAAAAPAAAPAAGGKIGIEDFAKVEMRVGEIKSAERVAGADRLLKVMVDIGSEVRQVVAGIALAYKPEDLVGKKVVVVCNLAPRKLRGVESNGMIVAASVEPDGRPVLATFTEDVPVGTRLK